jgi:ribosomal protein L28
MSHLCEITRKRYRRNGLPPSPGKKSEKRKPELLKRKIEVKELKGFVRLSVSPEGLELLKKSGGLAKFLKDREEKKLSTKLVRLKHKLYGKPKQEEKEEIKEKSASAKATEDKAPAAKEAKADKPVEAKAAPEAKEESAKPEEKKEEPSSAKAAEGKAPAEEKTDS